MQYPKNWPINKVGDLFDVLIGGTPSRKEPSYWDLAKTSENVWLSIRDVSNLRSIEASESLEYISDLGVKNSNVKLIPRNTAIMTFKLTLGKTAVTTRDLYTNEAIAAFVPKPGVIADPYYLATILPLLDYDVDQAVKGSTLNKAKIQEALIPLPEIKIQRRIAAILGYSDGAIDATQKVIDQTKKLKKALMYIYFGASESKIRLTEIATITMGQSPSGQSYTKELGTQTLPLLNGPSEFTNKYPVPVQWTNQITKTCHKGDILFCVRGSTTGRQNIADQRYCIGRGLAAIRGKEKVGDTQYIKFVLEDLANKILHEARGSGSTFPSISGDELRDYRVPHIPIYQQESLAEVLGSLDVKIDENAKVMDKYKLLRGSLMQDLLTGKVRV